MTLPPAPRDHASDIEAARLEADQLRAQGVPEDQVLARVEERLRAVNERMDQELQALARARASARFVATPRPQVTSIPQPYGYAFGLLTIAMVLGALLELTVGNTFVFVAADAYGAAMPWAMTVLIPLFAWLLWVGRRRQKTLGLVGAKESVRWSIAYPLMVMLLSTMAFVAPLGWFATYGAWAGQPSHEIEGKIVWLNEPSTSSKGCRQTASVQVLNNTVDICLSEVMIGPMPAEGASVAMEGQLSSAGFYVEAIHVR